LVKTVLLMDVYEEMARERLVWVVSVIIFIIEKLQ
jgi:hypothetical protein